MKIAVCLSGHLRTFEKTYQALQRNVLDKYDCDVFISTWENIGNILYHAHYKPGFDEADEKANIERVKEVYKPISINVENSASEKIKQIKQLFDGLKTKNGAKVNQIVPMFYKIADCNQLKKEHEIKAGINYKLTLRCRFDIFVNELNVDAAFEKIQFIPGYCGLYDIFGAIKLYG